MSNVWRWWKQVGKRIGDIQARVLLTLFYFVVMGPFAMVVRLGADPLTLKSGSMPTWRLKSGREGTAIEQATKQF